MKDYLDELGDLEWEEQQSLTLRMPEGQVVTKEGLLATVNQRGRSITDAAITD